MTSPSAQSSISTHFDLNREVPLEAEWRSVDQHEAAHVLLLRSTAYGILLQTLNNLNSVQLVNDQVVNQVVELSRFAQEAAATFTQAEVVESDGGKDTRYDFISSLLTSVRNRQEYFEPYVVMASAIAKLEHAGLLSRVLGQYPRSAFAITLAQVALNPPVFDRLRDASISRNDITQTLTGCDSEVRLRNIEKMVELVLEAIYPETLSDDEVKALREDPVNYVPQSAQGDQTYQRLSSIIEVDYYSYNYDRTVSNSKVRLSRMASIASYLEMPDLTDLLVRQFNPKTSEVQDAMQWFLDSRRNPESSGATQLVFPNWVGHDRVYPKSVSQVDFAALANFIVHTFICTADTKEGPYAIVHVAEKGHQDLFRIHGDEIDELIQELGESYEHWYVADWKSYDFERKKLSGINENLDIPFLACAGKSNQEIGDLMSVLNDLSYEKVMILSENPISSFPLGVITPAEKLDYVLLILVSRSQLQSMVYATELSQHKHSWSIHTVNTYKLPEHVSKRINLVAAHFYQNGF